MRSSRSQNGTREQQAKFIQERIASVEKHFADLCTIFGGYTRKTAALRDKSDEVASVLQDYAKTENVNKTLKESLSQFSYTLSGVGDYRDAQVLRFESKVVAELSQYEGICKHAKDELKNTLSARDKEMARKRYLNRIRERNPRNKQQITQAESELSKASADVSRTVRALEEQIDLFEKKKLHDVRSVLLDYITIELSFHTKAVELFTKAYQEIAEIDEEEDLRDFQEARADVDGEFREAIHVPESVSRLETVKRTSLRDNSFSLASLFSTPPVFKRSESAPGPLHSPTIKSDSVDSLKTGLGSSVASVHMEDYVEDELSSVTSEDDGSNIRNHYVHK